MDREARGSQALTDYMALVSPRVSRSMPRVARHPPPRRLCVAVRTFLCSLWTLREIASVGSPFSLPSLELPLSPAFASSQSPELMNRLSSADRVNGSAHFGYR